MGKFSFSLRWGSGFLWRTHTHTFAVCNFPLPRELEKPAGEFFALPCVVELCVRQKLLKSLTEGIYIYIWRGKANGGKTKEAEILEEKPRK